MAPTSIRDVEAWEGTVSDDGSCRQPLLVTTDPDMLDAMLHVSAVVDVDVHVVPDLADARPLWDSAPAVLIGSDVVTPHGAYGLGGLPERPRVAVVGLAGRGGPDGVPDLPWFLLPDDLSLVAAFLDVVPRRPARLVAVVGGRGGAGASTLAAALAVTAAGAGQSAMLVDADPYGGGLDLVLGAESHDGLRWADLDALHGPVASAVLVDTLPRAHGVTLLSYGREGTGVASRAAVEAVLDAGLRAHDLVVADLARHPDPGRDALLSCADLVLLVVPAEVRATAAAGRVAAHLGGAAGDVRLVVRGPAPSGLDARTVGRLLGLPCLGALRPEPGLTGHLERGDPPARGGRGPLADLCRRVLAEVGALAARAA